MTRLGSRVLLITGALFSAAASARAQAGWDAILALDPLASPYLSDWEANPTFGTLTVFNPTGQDQSVRLIYSVVDQQGRVAAEGRSEPQVVPADAPAIFDSPFEISGSSHHDSDLEDQMRRTGRLPEGDFRVCVAVVDLSGFQLAEVCESFSVVYPDPPLLVAPLNQEVITSDDVFFQWTPAQVPARFEVRYVLEVAEIQPGQLASEALGSNILHHHDPDVFGTQLQYPLGAQPFRTGSRYAWRVRALDGNGYPVSGNEGSSEIWTFEFDEAEPPALPPTAVTFSLYNGYQVAPPEGEVLTKSSPPTSQGLNQICDNWSSPPADIQLGVNVPFGFIGFSADLAVLHQVDDVASRSLPKKWWIYAQTDGGRAVLMHGNCNGPLSGLQWVAMRKLGRNQAINEFIAARNTGPIESVEYGVFVAALHGGGTVTAPASFREGSEFLAGNEFDVSRGLNVYAVLNLEEHSLWESFQALGFDEKQVTLYGFLGLDAEKAIGVGLGDSYEAQVSRSRSFLQLSAALPEREAIGPLGSFAESMQLSFEFEIEDSLGVNVAPGENSETNYALDLVFRVKHTINLREDLFPRADEGRALVGWIGLDRAGEREQQTREVLTRTVQRLNGGNGSKMAGFFGVDNVACAPKPDLEWHTDLVINYTLEGKLFIGPVFFEDPGFEIHIGPKAANGQRDLSFAFAAGLGVDGYEQRALFGVSRVREGPSPDADPACQKMRPRSNASVGLVRERSNAIDASDTTSRASGTSNRESPASPLHNPWKWNWKVHWDVIPVGPFSKAVSGGLVAFFIALGIGGG